MITGARSESSCAHTAEATLTPSTPLSSASGMLR